MVALAAAATAAAALGGVRGASAGEPATLVLAVFDIQTEGDVPAAVVDAINAELRKHTVKPAAYSLAEKMTTPLPDLLRTVGCTTATAACLGEVAGTVLTANRVLTGAIRPAPGGWVLLLRMLDVAARRYAKMVELRGTDAVVKSGIKDAVRWLLHRSPPPLLKVTSEPAGAEVYLDGARMGFAPVVIGERVPFGKHVVKVVHPGYVDYQQTISIVMGSTATVEAVMTK